MILKFTCMLNHVKTETSLNINIQFCPHRKQNVLSLERLAGWCCLEKYLLFYLGVIQKNSLWEKYKNFE
jgi:hypothetical protein